MGAVKRPDRVSPRTPYVLEVLNKFPNTPSRTLARILHEKHPAAFPTLESARNAIRLHRGANGNKNRKHIPDRGYRRQFNSPAVPMPASVADTWEPLQVDGPCRVLVLSDTHIPYHDAAAIEIAVNDARRQKPTVVLINGDGIDFYGVSRFEKDPGRRSPKAEIRDFVQFLRWLRSKFPKARLIYKLGNHDERWDKYIWSAGPVLWELEQVRLACILGYEMASQENGGDVRLESYGWEIVGDQRPVMAGRLPILHGHEIRASSPVNPARGAWLKTSHMVLIGHLHSTSQHTQTDMFHREVACWSVGCLCGLTPCYARVNRWNLGFAMVDVDQKNEFAVRNYRIVNGVVRPA